MHPVSWGSHHNDALRLLLYLHGQITAEETIPEDPVITFFLQGRPEEAKRALETWLSGEFAPPVTRSSRSMVFDAFSVLGRPQDAIEYSKSYLARIGTPMGKMGAFCCAPAASPRTAN